MLTHTRLIGSINIKRKRHIMAQHNLVCRGAAVAAAVGSVEVLPAGTPWECWEQCVCAFESKRRRGKCTGTVSPSLSDDKASSRRYILQCVFMRSDCTIKKACLPTEHAERSR